MKLSDVQANQIAHQLMGTTDYEEIAINQILGSDIEAGNAEVLFGDDMMKIYDVVERCGGCGWWCEVGELDEDNILCSDCREEAV